MCVLVSGCDWSCDIEMANVCVCVCVQYSPFFTSSTKHPFAFEIFAHHFTKPLAFNTLYFTWFFFRVYIFLLFFIFKTLSVTTSLNHSISSSVFLDIFQFSKAILLWVQIKDAMFHCSVCLCRFHFRPLWVGFLSHKWRYYLPMVFVVFWSLSLLLLHNLLKIFF